MTQQAKLNLLAQAEQLHPGWSRVFQNDDRVRQIDDDLFAAKSVCGVLIAIVSAGVLLGALSVLLTTLL